MTNREKIAEMKMVDFYAKYYGSDYGTFTQFVCESINCNKCPVECRIDDYGYCRERIDKWLDKECDD